MSNALTNQVNPRNVVREIEKLKRRVRSLELKPVRAESADLLVNRIGNLDYEIADDSGNIRAIMSPSSLQDRFGVPAYILAMDITGNPKFYVDADTGTIWAEDGIFDGSITAHEGFIGGFEISDDYLIHDDSIDAQSAGLSPDDYPFYAGALYANRASAPFRVTTAGALFATGATISGTITATSGTIGGWSITTTTIEKTSANIGIVLDSSVPSIKIGNTAGTHILIDGANQVIKSSNYTAGLIGSSWTTSTGDAEFNNITARGALKVTAIQSSTVMATGGTNWIVPAVGVLRDDLTSVDSPTTFAVNIKDPDGLSHAAAGSLWAVSDRIRLKEPLTGDLWASISSKTDNTTYWTLNVAKQSPGAGTNYTFRAGLAVLNYGASGAGFIALSADASVGSTPNITMATHAGSPWSTFTSLTRIGNLNGSYGYVANTYGVGIGSYGVASQTSLTLETTNGIRIINNTTVIGQWSASGVITVGQVAASQNNILISSGAFSVRNNTTERIGMTAAGILTIKDSGGAAVFSFDASVGAEFTKPLTIGTSGGIYQGTGTFASPTTGLKIFNSSGVGKISTYNTGVEQVTFDTDGKLKAGAGKIILDIDGASAVVTTGPSDDRAYRFKSGSTTTGGLYGWQPDSVTNNIDVRAYEISSRDSTVRIMAEAPSGRDANVNLVAVVSGSFTNTLSVSGSLSFGGFKTILSLTEGMFINDTENAQNTMGLTINQGTTDNEILSLKSSDIAHGVTTITETDTWALFSKANATNGGLALRGLALSTTSGVNIFGSQGTAITTKNTTARGALNFDGQVISGTGLASLGANGNIASFRDNGTTRFILDADGDSHQDVGTAWTNFHGHKDNDLLQLLSAHVSRTDDPLREQFGSFLTQNKQKLESLKLVSFSEDGHHFVNMSRLTMLLVGAVIQANERIGQLEQRLFLE